MQEVYTDYENKGNKEEDLQYLWETLADLWAADLTVSDAYRMILKKFKSRNEL